MSHTSRTETTKTSEFYDQEGKLFKRVVTHTIDEFNDLEPDAEVDEKEIGQAPEELLKPGIQPATTFRWRLPEEWKVYCMNGIEPCPAHSNYPHPLAFSIPTSLRSEVVDEGSKYPGRSAG